MSSQDFKNHVLQRFYQDVHQVVPDNYSARRFSFDGVDRSNVFEVGKHITYLDWFMRSCDQLFAAYSGLADQASKDLLIDIIRYRLAGHLHVRINSRVATLRDESERFAEAFVGSPSSLRDSGMFGPLEHFDREWNGERYIVDTLDHGLNYLLVFRQYFFERGDVRIAPESGDHIIDGGACFGDSTVVFSKSVGPKGRVYAFDPLQNHLDVCRYNAEQQTDANIALFGYGLSDRAFEAPPVRMDTYSPGFRVEAAPVPLCRIDDLVMDRRIERVDFIKMDIEGSEMAALRGALASIHRFRPKLAISIYHKPDDLFEIWRLLSDQQLGYSFYLDHYAIYDEETVLYAIAN